MDFKIAVEKIIDRVESRMGIPEFERELIDTFPRPEEMFEFSLTAALTVLKQLGAVAPEHHIEMDSYITAIADCIVARGLKHHNECDCGADMKSHVARILLVFLAFLGISQLQKDISERYAEILKTTFEKSISDFMRFRPSDN